MTVCVVYHVFILVGSPQTFADPNQSIGAGCWASAGYVISLTPGRLGAQFGDVFGWVKPKDL